MKKPPSYVVLAALASAVLYFALDLSSSNRGPVDYAVIGLVILAVLWNLLQLSRRLYRDEGYQSLWSVLRTLLFWIIGLLNTAFLSPESVGGWRNWLGWAMLVLAILDTIGLYLREQNAGSATNA